MVSWLPTSEAEPDDTMAKVTGRPLVAVAVSVTGVSSATAPVMGVNVMDWAA